MAADGMKCFTQSNSNNTHVRRCTGSQPFNIFFGILCMHGSVHNIRSNGSSQSHLRDGYWMRAGGQNGYSPPTRPPDWPTIYDLLGPINPLMYALNANLPARYRQSLHFHHSWSSSQRVSPAASFTLQACCMSKPSHSASEESVSPLELSACCHSVCKTTCRNPQGFFLHDCLPCSSRRSPW